MQAHKVSINCVFYLQEETSPLPGQLLKPHPQGSAPDMSPFFLRQYVKGHANDVFEDYPQLLTEMVLRLPYQVSFTLGVFHANQISMCLDPHLN